MRTTHKYLLDGPETVLYLPRTAMFRSVRILENGNAHIWFELDDSLARVPRRFKVFGTGRMIPNNATYICTVHDPTELITYVWHIYEVPL